MKNRSAAHTEMAACSATTARKAALFAVFATTCFAAQPSYWTPPPDSSWQWQLTGAVDQTVNAAIYDIDLFDSNASLVASLHAQGRRVICYVSVGSWESFRPDAAAFPASVKGKTLDGYPNERWLDIRNLDTLGPILAARLDLCKAKGFDAVEPDNVDGYANDSGFPLTYADQIRFNSWLAGAAHARGLSVGLKNDLDQVSDLQPLFDWALNEQCFQYAECNALMPFVRANKAVFHVEYQLTTAQFCGKANNLNFNSMRKDLNLDAYREPCRAGQASALQVYQNGAVNAASLLPSAVAPGEIVTLFGFGLGPALPAYLSVTAGRVDTTAGGVRVYFDGIPAPLIYVQSNQINLVVPYEVQGKNTVQMQVEFMGVRSDPVSLPVSETSPGIFTFDPGGKGQGAILNEDGKVNSASNPAAAGSIVVLFATGEGQTGPPGENGKVAADSLPKPLAPVSVQIGGLDAEVLYAGAAPGNLAGLLQVNVRTQKNVSPGAAVPVQLKIGNLTSQAGVTVAIR